MKIRLGLVTAIVSILYCGMPALAQDAPDPEDAKTPTNLVELLPEAGLGEGMDFFLLREDEQQELSTYRRWTLKSEGDNIVCIHEEGCHEAGFPYQSTSKLVYDKAGKLLSTEMVVDDGESIYTASGSIVGDKLIIRRTVTYHDPEENGRPFDPTVIKLKDLERAFPIHLMPLVVAHHIREGNFGYSVKMYDCLATGSSSNLSIEDNGTEMVEVDGEQQEAHFLTIKTKPDPDPRFPGDRLREDVMTVRVLQNGTIVSLDLVYEGKVVLEAKGAAAKKVEEVMGFKPAEGHLGDDAGPPDAKTE